MEEVSAVIAPSALEQKAEISPIMKVTPISGDIYSKAAVGNSLSFTAVMFFCSANK